MVTLGREPSGCRGSAHAYLSNLCCSKCCLCKAPISLGCDEFAMGLRIDSPNRRELSRNCRETFAWYRKVLACIANSSRTGRQSFKHVILFCATKIIAKPSPSHRICREPVANPSQTFANTLQGSFRDLHNATNMRHK